MSLDCIWMNGEKTHRPSEIRNQDRKEIQFDPPLDVITHATLRNEGEREAETIDSFIGDKYKRFFAEMLGVDLYENKSSKECIEISGMIYNLDEGDWEYWKNSKIESDNPKRKSELEDLSKMFYEFAEEGAWLHGYF